MDWVTLGTALFGLVGTPALFWLVHRDATRIGVSRRPFWAGISAGTFAAGVALLVFTSAPLVGAILTANTGLVFYTFEREVATEDDDTREPGTLPEK